MIGPWSNGGELGEARHQSAWHEMFEFSDPSELQMTGYNFQAGSQLDLAQRQGFESVIRVIACVLAHSTRFCTHSVSANELFRIFRMYLENHGWSVAGEAACEWLVDVRASRNTLLADDGWRANWSIHTESQVAVLNARRVIARQLFGGVKSHTVDERSESGVFENTSCGKSVVHLSVYKHYGLFHIHAMCAFDDALERAAQEFFNSQYLWTLYPKNYCSKYGQHNDRPGTVVINRPIEGRDGDGIYLECFDAGGSMKSSAKKWNIPLAPAQMHLKCENRSL